MVTHLAWAGAVRRAAQRLDSCVERSRLALWFTAATPLLVLYLLTMRTQPDTMGIDTIAVTPSAWQLAHHGTPLLPAGGDFYQWFMIPSGHGQVISNREPGLIGLAAIFYWLAPSASIWNVVPASIAAAVVTSAAMGTLALVFRRLASARVALFGSLIAGTATTTWAVSGTSLWPHSADQLYLTVALLALASARYAWTGLAFAFAVLTRPPLGVVAAVIGLRSSLINRSIRPALVIGAITACGVAGYFAYSRAFWGGGIESQYTAASDGSFVANLRDFGASGLGDFVVNVVGTLVSPGRGVLPASPFLIVLIPGLRAAWRESPQWVRSAAISGVFYMAVQLKSNRFGGGQHYWGYRYPIAMLTLLAPLFLISWRVYASRTARRRAAFASLLIVSVAYEAIGAFCFGVKTYFSDWLPRNFVWALRERPVVALTICAVAYVGAAVTYRVVSRRGFDTSESTAQRLLPYLRSEKAAWMESEGSPVA